MTGTMFHIKMDKDMYTSILSYSSLNFNLNSTLITFLTCVMLLMDYHECAQVQYFI